VLFPVGAARDRPALPELDRADRLLLELRDWLYDGSWDEMLADLAARLAGRPYLFELFADLPDESERMRRMFDDIRRIRRMSALESELGIDLADGVAAQDGRPSGG